MIVFEENFTDNRHDWTLLDNENVVCKITPDGYLIQQMRTGQGRLTSKTINLQGREAFKIQAAFQGLQGEREANYGLVWGLQGSSYYSFRVSLGGYYAISQVKSGTRTTLHGWTETPYLHAHHRLNHLMIRQSGSMARFYINHYMSVALTLPQPNFGPNVGFVAFNKISFIVQRFVVTTERAWHFEAGPTSAQVSQAPVKEEAMVSATEPTQPEENLEQVLAELNQLIGLENIKEAVQTLTNYLKVQKVRQERGLSQTPVSLHMVLTGPPGTGKTTVARLIGRIYKALGFLAQGHIVETDRAGLVGGYVGQTALKVDELVEEAHGGILFVDEAYALMPENARGHDFGQEAIDVLMKRMEDQRGEFAVIIAGYTTEMHRFLEANPGVKSRFNRYYKFDHYTGPELTAIFEKFCQSAGYMLIPNAQQRAQNLFAAAYKNRDESFGNGRFARNLFEKMIEQQANRIADMDPLTDELLTTIEADDIEAAAEVMGLSPLPVPVDEKTNTD